jgi:RpiR family transcriptional regulator, carbohydrate utilization regulator
MKIIKNVKKLTKGLFMAGMLVKIGALRENLPNAERLVADYLANSPEKAGFQSISDIAESVSVSVASVSRLSKKLGYANYKDLRADLAHEIVPEDHIGDIYKSIKPSDSDEDIAAKVFSGNIKSLKDTSKILNHNDLKKAAEKISKARRLIFFGFGSSGHICKDAALRFSFLDMQAESYSDSLEIIVQALRLGKDDVAVGISHSGRSRITVEALKIVKNNNATTISISNYLKSPLDKYSDIFLCTSFAENRVKVAALSSRIAQMCILDTLYLLTAKHKRVFKKAELMNNYTEELLRY